MTTRWQQTSELAWTDSDGPGRPPAGMRPAVSGVLAGSLGVVMAGVLMTDTLCPEHRAWVDALAVTALLGSVVAVVGVLRGWASSTWLTTLVAACGVGIGVLDAVHSPARGQIVALAFGLVTLLAASLLIRDVRLRVWDRHVRGQVADLPETATVQAPVPAPAEVQERSHQ